MKTTLTCIKTTPFIRKAKISKTLRDRVNLNLRNHDSDIVSSSESGIVSLLRLKDVIIPMPENKTGPSPAYHKNILQLLDDLQCPVLLLPHLTNNQSDQRIGFFTDILFTGPSTLALLVKIAKSFRATITVFNIPETALPKMDPAYAEKHFKQQGLSKVNGLSINLVNIDKGANISDIESILNEHHITLVATVQQRKELLYKLVS